MSKHVLEVRVQSTQRRQPFGLLLLTTLIFAIFSLSSLFHEYIFQRLPGFHFPLYATFVQFLVQGCCAGLPLLTSNGPKRTAPLSAFAFVGMTGRFIFFMSNLSNLFDNFLPRRCAFRRYGIVFKYIGHLPQLPYPLNV